MGTPEPSAAHAIARELDLVEDAVRAVLAGAATRIVVGGLRFGEDVLRRSAADAAARDVVLEPVWRLDETGCDVLVRRAVSP